VIVDLDPSDALAAAAELNRCAAAARHRGSNPPDALERIADVLIARALLDQYFARKSDSGQAECKSIDDTGVMVTVTTAAIDLDVSNRQVRRLCVGLAIPGARRVNPLTPGSPWLVPASYVAANRPTFRSPSI
jgi:hypothetical protein